MKPTALIVPILILAFALPADSAETRPPAASDEADAVRPSDPVVSAVVRMLQEGVEAKIIDDWLHRTAARPGKLTPDDLIALTRANAPEDLIRTLLDLAPGSPETKRAPETAAPDASPGRVAGDTPSDAARATAEPGAPVPAAGAGAAAPEVLFTVAYHPDIVEANTTPWDLFVYVDGRPVTWASGWASHTTNRFERRSLVLTLAPGRHMVRLTQEQHRVKSKRKGTWRHSARVFPRPISFDLDSAGEWQVEIDVSESGSSFVGGDTPVDYRITRDGKTVDEGTDLGPSVHRWQSLCEDAESGFSPEERDSRAARRAVRGCVRWTSLWEGVEGSPDRLTVLEELESVGFEPGPAD